MIATNSYKVDAVVFNNLHLSSDVCFAISRALRARSEMLLGMLGELEGGTGDLVTRDYLLKQLAAVDGAKEIFNTLKAFGVRV